MLKIQYYNNIDTMPIYNYLQIVEHGNNSALIKKPGFFKRNFIKAFENIQRQLVDRFGISEPYMEQLELRQEIAALECDVAITDNRFNNLFINIKKTRLKALQERKGNTTDEIKIMIEKDLKFYISLHKITVAEWFSYVKNYSKKQPKEG